MTETAVLLARWQFALTALYHFLFVPLTLGLSFILAIMESVFVLTQKNVWRDMTKFWGVLFGINFAMGVATGITMEFQFGTNWAYFSQYVGDIFGAFLAVEGLMAFFLEATFIGLFYFGWQRLSQRAHLMVTWLLAFATSMSALWILIANAWMQNPVGSAFNFRTMRMELTSFWEVFFNPIAQTKFLHTVSSGYVTGAVFVCAVSGFYLLKKRHMDLARRSMWVGSVFGLISILTLIVAGDESGYEMARYQKMKLAGIEGIWQQEDAPAAFTLWGWPDVANRTTYGALKIPGVLGVLTTRSLTTCLPGIKELVEEAKYRIQDGTLAYAALQTLKSNPHDMEALKVLEAKGHNLGHALLVKKYDPNVIGASQETIQKAAELTIPNVWPLFWSFRIMVGIGFLLLGFFMVACYLSLRDKIVHHRWFLRGGLFILPLPWIAGQLGWIVAEHGRQPWAICGILPTFLGTSSVDVGSVVFTLTGFVVFYTALACTDLFLMVKYIRMGPERSLHVGARY